MNYAVLLRISLSLFVISTRAIHIVHSVGAPASLIYMCMHRPHPHMWFLLILRTVVMTSEDDQVAIY